MVLTVGKAHSHDMQKYAPHVVTMSMIMVIMLVWIGVERVQMIVVFEPIGRCDRRVNTIGRCW